MFLVKTGDKENKEKKVLTWHITCFLGITPSNELRDPPKYLRYVSSEPLDDETFYKEYNEEFSQDESDTKCFQVWTSTKKKLSQSSNVITCNSSQRRSPQPPNPSTAATLMPPRPKYAGEKIPNFISTNSNGYSSSSLVQGQRSMVTPPLSPGKKWQILADFSIFWHFSVAIVVTFGYCRSCQGC